MAITPPVVQCTTSAELHAKDDGIAKGSPVRKPFPLHRKMPCISWTFGGRCFSEARRRFQSSFPWLHIRNSAALACSTCTLSPVCLLF